MWHENPRPDSFRDGGSKSEGSCIYVLWPHFLSWHALKLSQALAQLILFVFVYPSFRGTVGWTTRSTTTEMAESVVGECWAFGG
jgi:hypothetical protein